MLPISPNLTSAYNTLCLFIPTSPAQEADQQIADFYFHRYDDLLTRSNTKIHITSSAFVINESRTKALLIYHKIYDSWSWLGGHADGEGDLLSVAVHEVQEESGCCAVPLSAAPISLEILPVSAHKRRGEPVPEHLHLNFTFLLQASENAPLLANESETAGAAWFPLEDVLSACSEEPMRPIYRKIIRRIREGFPD